ncbi:MAG: phage Gp37/Gp68 family protein [Actinomycetia bacterium]|nr:phage Gp37/Gp68 family protein [Actinomycetes bacterium]
MAQASRIEWTDATWNPVIGCTRVSEGCQHCYAERLSRHFGWTDQPWTAAHAEDVVRVRWDRLETPVHWRRPRRIFVNSLSDLFHETIPDNAPAGDDAFRDAVFGIMALTPWHTYQVLTKRIERAAAWWTDPQRQDRVALAAIRWKSGLPPGTHRDVVWEHVPWPLPNVWLGVSVETQRRAAERLPVLASLPAAVRFVSCEPLLEPVDLQPWLAHLDWVIVGGESGPGARPLDDDWVRAIRDQCQAAGVPFFFKQRVRRGRKESLPWLDGRRWAETPRAPLGGPARAHQEAQTWCTS